MKKRKGEILRNKEPFTAQSTEHSTEQSSVQSTVQSTKQPSIQSTVQSDYIYGVGMLAVLAIGVCVFFAYNTFQPKIKKLTNDHSTARHEQKKDQLPKRHPVL